MVEEIDRIRARGGRLVGQGGLSVYQAHSHEIPALLPEIGRLREITFREVGEGSGHDIDLDHAALMAALPSPAPYVGLLGARRRLPERLDRLKAAGLTERDLARLRAPIGLDIGGKAPWEVAVATLGEIIAVRSATSNLSPVLDLDQYRPASMEAD